MKVTSEDIRNLAEALPLVKKYMDDDALFNLYGCVNIAIEDFKKRLLYEEDDDDDDDEYCTMDEVIEERDRMNELADCVRKVTDLVKELDELVVRIPSNEETEHDD